MSMDFDLPEDVEGENNYLNEPGTFHLVVESVGNGKGPKGNPIDGFSVDCRVLAGTVAGSVDKTTTLTFWAPNFTKSEASQLASKRQNAAMLIACNAINPTLLGKKASVDVESLAGNQFLVTLERQMDADESGKYTIEGKFLRIHYSSIFHVDDPDAAGFPKDAEAISVIKKEFRHAAEWFAFKAKKKATANAGQAAANSGKTGGDDFANL